MRVHGILVAGLVALAGGCELQDGDVVAEIGDPAKAAVAGESQTEPALVTADGDAPPFEEEAGHKHTNRLARETSPYLLLHAHNPVDWYPWGPEAFEKAQREGKMIFLSIGYSSCYWCHVMERLVFENEDIARQMNEQFVCIKVDREERPDVDDIYMTALQIYFQMAGSPQGGGWPLSMFLTPEGKPLAGGTYFPPEDKEGRPGFKSVMDQILTAWNESREGMQQTADHLTQALRRSMKPKLVLTPVELERSLADEVTQALAASHDAEYGGVDFNSDNPNAPKFPVPVKLTLLQYETLRDDRGQAAEALYDTLDHLAAGGIYDHLGGGFHRYSTDRFWHVPHFEKMLYDQAQLADVYVEAFRQTRNPLYRNVAEGVFAFVLREMTDPRGGFYSALDAETDGVEGAYYVWSEAQIDEALSSHDAELFKRAYGLKETKRFEHGYVLHLPTPLAELAKAENLSPSELQQKLGEMRVQLLAVRSQRPALLKDDKILTSWNGLMIRALAHAGAVFERPDYLQAAERAAGFILDNMRDEEGRLHRTYRAEQAKLNAYVDDYAFFAESLLALYQATGRQEWLQTARELTDDQIRLFWDESGGAFFFTPHHHEQLIARTKNAYDAVLPAGNSVSVRNLLRLAAFTGDESYRKYALETLQVFAPALKDVPRGMTCMALALAEYLDKPDFGPVQSTPSQSTSLGGQIVQVGGERPANPASEKKEDEKRVKARSFLSVDKLPAGKSCRIVMLLDVAEGWHINSNPPKPDFCVPTKFSLKSKLGTKLAEVKYPAGKPLTIVGLDEPQHVYEGRVAIYGTLEVPADAAGKSEEFELKVYYQPCDEQRCLKPETVVLRGKLPVSGPGESVKQINQNLFPKANER